MQTIKYIFSDGTASEIEVTDEFYTLYAELVQQDSTKEKETYSGLFFFGLGAKTAS